MGAGGQAGTGGRDWSARVMINNDNGYTMVDEGVGSRDMAKNCLKNK